MEMRVASKISASDLIQEERGTEFELPSDKLWRLANELDELENELKTLSNDKLPPNLESVGTTTED